MPYISDFEQFFNEAEKMYLEHPAHVRFATARHTLRHPPAHARNGDKNCASATGALHRQPPHSTTPQTRYVMRYRHCDGKLILKVTDDRVCLKFQTDQQTDVKKMERLNNLFFAHMCGEDPHEPEPDEKAAPARPKSEDASEKRPASSEGAPGKKRKGKK